MHEGKTGYFRYIKPVRRQNSDWGICISIYACNYWKMERKACINYNYGKKNRWKEKPRNKKYSLVRSIVGIIGRGVFVLSVHIITGERILNQMDSK